MEFALVYRGLLHSTRPGIRHKQKLRRSFHPQLKELWEHDPLRQLKPHIGQMNVIIDVGGWEFLPVVSNGFSLKCELEILFLRPSPPGLLFAPGGDIDNRIKTLIDGLTVPKRDQLPVNWKPAHDEIPFHCLLQDDALVTAFSVRTERLLASGNKKEVQLMIRVKIRAAKKTALLMGLID